MTWRKLFYEQKTGAFHCWWRMIFFLGFALLTTFTLSQLFFVLLLPPTVKDLRHISPVDLSVLVIISIASIATAFIFAGFWALRVLEGLPPHALGISLRGSWGRFLMAGICAGLGMVLLFPILLCALRFGTMHWHSMSTVHWQTLAWSCALLLLAALSFEVVFHGYIFQTLLRGIGPLPSLLVVATVGTTISLLGYLMVSPISTITPIHLVNMFILLILLGMAYLRFASLWAPIGLCMGWFMCKMLFPVSGQGLSLGLVTPVTFIIKGPTWFSGGNLGLDAGVVGSVGLLLLLSIVSYMRVGLPLESRWWEWNHLRKPREQPASWDFSIGSRYYQWKLFTRDNAE